MKRLIVKGKDQIFPTVIWQGTQLVVYYLGEQDDEVSVKETRGINFDEMLLHLDRGGSVFLTVKPTELDAHERKNPLGNYPCLGYFFKNLCKSCDSEVETDECEH
ncbi:MAG TPA: hypothetical protein VM050_04865 [Patescibacteria group bacterium]|nr:hypothetical protein [Patescibacteria group bacterium]